MKFLLGSIGARRNLIRNINFITILIVGQHLSAQPFIKSFTPESGPVGTTVTIMGTNFSATATGNIVYFGATKAFVSSATTTALTATVPAGATYEPISVTTNNLTAYSAKPFNIAFSGAVAISSTSFAPEVTYATGTNPSSVVLNDIDLDGKPDVIITNTSSNTISVLLNQTSGATNSFASHVDFPSAASPANLVVADMDGDGKKDLAVVNSVANTVSVFRNLSTVGVVAFATRIDFPTGSNPQGLAVLDLDEDGKPEIVVTNYASNTISVLKNISAGAGNVAFAAKMDYTAGDEPTSVAIGDMNGDEKPDLVVTNATLSSYSPFYPSNTFSIFKNIGASGTIALATKVDFKVNGSPVDLSLSDFDNDGKLDVALVVLPSFAQILVYRNSSTTNNFTFEYGLNLQSEINTSSIAIANINGDDKPDIVVANANAPGTVSAYDNTSRVGYIWFSTKTDFKTGDSTRTLALGDVNGDGRTDIIAGNYNSNNISVLLNQIPLASNAITIGSLYPNTYCIGGPIAIPFIATGAYGADNVFTAELSDGSGIFSNPVAIGTFTGTSSGTINANIPSSTYPFNYYKIRVRSSNPVTIGTPNANNLTMSNSFPVSTNGSTVVCQGSQLNLSATPINGATYYWTGPNGFSATTPNVSITNVNETTSGEYMVTVNQNGCSSDASTNVIVNPLPAVPAITASTAPTFCMGGSVALVSSSASGNQWYKDGIAINNATATSYTASVSGNYTLRATEHGCISSASAGINVTAIPNPAKPIITSVDNTLISSVGSGNQWYLNEMAITGATKQLYTTQVSGQYTVQVTQNGCNTASDAFNFVATKIIVPSQLDCEVMVYPNPVDDRLFISNSNLRALKLQLVNAMGRVIFSAGVTASSSSIPMNQLPAGNYYLMVTDTSKNETIVRNIVKQ